MASVGPPPVEEPIATRVPGVIREPGSTVGILLVVLERGRVDKDASLGKLFPPLRVGALGAPDARFLRSDLVHNDTVNIKISDEPLFDDIRLQREWSDYAVKFLGRFCQ